MQQLGLAPYDIAMLVVLVAATAWGAIKGMAWQVASLLSIVAGYFVALRYRDQVAPLMPAQAPLDGYLAMLVLYVGSSLAVWVAFRFVAGFIDRVQMRGFDRQLGAMFGAAKGVLICVVVTFFAVTLSASARSMVLDSRSGIYIAKLIDQANPLLPPDVHQLLDPYLKRLDQGLNPNGPAPQAPELGIAWPGDQESERQQGTARRAPVVIRLGEER